MKKNEFEKLHPNKKLDVLFEEILKIKGEVHVAWWKKALTWFVNNFFTLLILFLLIWGGMKIFEIIENVQTSVEEVSTNYKSVGNSVKNTLGGFKFWE